EDAHIAVLVEADRPSEVGGQVLRVAAADAAAARPTDEREGEDGEQHLHDGAGAASGGHRVPPVVPGPMPTGAVRFWTSVSNQRPLPRLLEKTRVNDASL